MSERFSNSIRATPTTAYRRRTWVRCERPPSGRNWRRHVVAWLMDSVVRFRPVIRARRLHATWPRR